MKTIVIDAKLREKLGKSSGNAYRRDGFVLGVIYGGAKEIHFVASQKDLKPLVYTPEFMKTEIKIDGNSYSCIVKDLQFHKVTDNLIHIDLLELSKGKKVKAEIPLKLVGNSVGVKEGGRLVFKLKKVKVAATPENLREVIEVDITHLKIGQNIRIEDIKAEGISILNSPKVPVVGVVVTRALKQEAAADPKAAAPKAAAAKS